MIPMQKVFYFILQDKRGGSFYIPPPVYSHSNQFLAAKIDKKIEREEQKTANESMLPATKSAHTRVRG